MMLSGQTKAGDLLSLLMLYSVSTAFKSLLRPSDLSSPDRGPAESVAGLCHTLMQVKNIIALI